MNAAATEAKPVEPEMTDQILTDWIEVRGIRYELTELEIGDYTKIEKQATIRVKVPDGEGGEVEVERIDANTRTNMMMAKCITSPKNVNIQRLGTRAYGAISRMISEMHFGDEPVKTSRDKAKADEEGKGSPNA